MTISVTKRGAMLSAAETRGHTVRIDVPKDWGGEDSGMTPTELFAASVGGCSQFFLTRFLHGKGVDPEGTVVEVTYEVDESHTRITRMAFEIHFGAGVPEEMRDPASKVASACILHKTLEHPPEVVNSWS